MSDTSETMENRTDAQRRALAEAFDRDVDPLAAHATTFESTEIDPFAIVASEVLDARELVESTRKRYDATFQEWREHMESEGRHPACPNEEHVKRFIRYELAEEGKSNHPETVKAKLRKLNVAYTYWQDDPAFPHPQDYNPIQLARSKVSFTAPETKEPPRIPMDELRDVLDGVAHLRDRAVIVLQLKIGARATELCNIQLADLSIQNSEVLRNYPDMGTNPMLDGRENVLYIPHEREGNKSQRPRLLPLDDETRHVLVRYLLVRPDSGSQWLFLSKQANGKLRKQSINRAWKRAFHPEYAETERHRGVTSHYGRHRFTTYWRVEQDLNRDLVRYMRGDKPGGATTDDPGPIDSYIHTYYEDIADLYLENIYKLRV
ncbi:tyrosine-type recombinase/integrase [Halococcus saccharolyticus]|uniref:Integrase family protein n=1 Tax=Halococcus saccharolyticus DSM 5350 TaxID=1227455 RepID=M0MBK1_9EURY|nr:site-specific integrase [Halococcus saccharolyticus]EMA43157.1 integrase family protein [Halococcus saccharolyticus DSM 5350]